MLPRTLRKFWLSWTLVGLLTLLCATLAVMQNRWINEISAAERNRLHAALQTNLDRLSRDFDQQIVASYTDLKPSFADIVEWGTQVACSRQYDRWRTTDEPIFRRIGLVILEQPQPKLYLLDMQAGEFSPAAWPVEWKGVQARFEARLRSGPIPPLLPEESALLELPLFGSMHRAPVSRRDAASVELPKEDWLIPELSLDYVRSTMLPIMVDKYLVGSGLPAYDAEIVPIRALSTASAREPDSSVDLLDLRRVEGQNSQRSPNSVESTGPARWRLLVRHRGDSLEDRVSAARWRNLALSGGILLLIFTTVVVLLHYARKSQNLVGLQMNFVAGVSHELRTPLTVIRTAAFNLRGKLATRPEQVEKYGRLIQTESEKLSVLVEQVLRYGAASAGRVIGERRPVNTNRLIDSSVETSAANAPGNDLTVDREVDPGLPMILADELALKHALQNLLDNAFKYGVEGNGWIGISAHAILTGDDRLVEIRVADRGPGIPDDEKRHLFDAFFRGKRAVQDQVHGTGLGLNLVKSIVEAHGGTIRVESEPGTRTEFIIRVPAAPEESEDVFSNTAG